MRERDVKPTQRYPRQAPVFSSLMELNLLSRHLVSFRGPALDRSTRAALSAAAVSIIERRQREDWGGQLQEFVVSVEARDDGDAVRRVAAALEKHGAYGGFAPAPASQ